MASFPVRATSLVVAACVVATALWSANIPDERWFAWFHDREERLPAASLMPRAAPTPPPAPEDRASSVESQKRLRLVSTAPGRNAFEGTARLGVDPVNPQTYAAGALLENGAALREIYPDHVLLERDGLVTKLYVEAMAEGSHSGPRMKTNDVSTLAVEGRAHSIPAPAAPPTYTEIIRAAPQFENQAIIGFNIYPGSKRGEFSRLGLQPGDLLMSVDGAPLTSTEALNSSLQAVGSGRAVTATVSRNGREVTLSLDGAIEPESEASFASTPPTLSP